MNLSYSSLKQFAKSPNHFLQYLNREVEETPAMIFGSAVHCAILEPERWDERYFVLNEDDIIAELSEQYKSPRSSKAYKEWKANEIASAGDRTILDLDTMDKIRACTNSFADNPQASHLLQKCIRTESKITFEHKGHNIRGYIDGEGMDFMFDIKVISDANPEWMARNVIKNLWHMQGAIYTFSQHRKQYLEKDYYMIIVESVAPFNTQVYKLDSDFLLKGFNKFEETIDALNEWDGNPQGYSNDIIHLDVPAWA